MSGSYLFSISSCDKSIWFRIHHIIPVLDWYYFIFHQIWNESERNLSL